MSQCMRFSRDWLGTWGFMHEISYWIMHNGFCDYALPNLQIRCVFTCSPHGTWFFGGQNLPWYSYVPWIHPLNIISKLANTFPCQPPKRRNRNLKVGTGHMHFVSLMPQKTMTPLEPQPSVNLAQFENTSHSMTGSVLCSILTPINPFCKKNSLNTLHLSPMDVDTM